MLISGIGESYATYNNNNNNNNNNKYSIYIAQNIKYMF